ncbi:MAG: hypothetical protein JSR26_02300 [Proteobacteria bacterium]|nr:hypothetical protein [Pseudomonadota bacterium]
MKQKLSPSVRGFQAAATLIEAFRSTLASSKSELPSTRCLSRPSLVEVLMRARDSADITLLRNKTATALIRLLVDASVVRPVALEPMAPRMKSDRLYLVGLDITDTALDAAELLQAHEPQGILCYFTAIELHGLTTQPAPHHHVARIRKAATSAAPAAAMADDASMQDSMAPLGSPQFRINGLTYYLTRRDPKGLKQTQRRQLNPHCQVTVTGLEQTLLDCLHRPISAGGAAVVFEAWEAGLRRSSPEKIATLATKIGDPLLLRRAGYMIAQYQPKAPALASLLDQVRAQCRDSEAIPSLLPGIAYRQVDATWRLRTS